MPQVEIELATGESAAPTVPLLGLSDAMDDDPPSEADSIEREALGAPPTQVNSMLDQLPSLSALHETRSWAAPAVLAHFASLGSGASLLPADGREVTPGVLQLAR